MLSWRKEAPGVRNISQHCVPALSCRGHLSRRHVTSCVTCHVSRVACPVSRAARNTLIIKRKQGSQEGTKPGIIPSHQAGKSIPFTLASTEHWAWMELLPSASEALLQQSPNFFRGDSSHAFENLPRHFRSKNVGHHIAISCSSKAKNLQFKQYDSAIIYCHLF